MRVKATMLIVGALAVTGIAAGCGGGDDNGDTTTTSLTKAAWIAKADTICKASDAQTNAAAKQRFGNHQPSPDEVKQFVLNTTIPTTQRVLDQIRALGTPTQEGSQAKAVIDSAQSTLDRVKADPDQLVGSDADPFGQTNRLARAYGLKFCGQG
jgi:hypothetical protein